MDKRDTYRVQFLQYLKQQPPCLFVETDDVNGRPCDEQFVREMGQVNSVWQVMRTTDKFMRASSAGVVALFPQYLAFFTQGKRNTFLRMFARQLPLAATGLDGLVDIGGAVVRLGKDAVHAVRHEQQHYKLKLNDIEGWLAHPHAFVIPLSEVVSMDQDRGTLWVKEKDDSIYLLFEQQYKAFKAWWPKRLMKAYGQLQGQR
jgi:hypothetical protein